MVEAQTAVETGARGHLVSYVSDRSALDAVVYEEQHVGATEGDNPQQETA